MCANTLVVPANAGTHTARCRYVALCQTPFVINDRRWLWVPAFAGTTIDKR
jgi:hypothetical protein